MMGELSFKEIITVTFVLIAVIDVPGNLTVFLSLKEKTGSIQAGKSTLTAFLILVGFLFVGELFLQFVGIDLASFALAAGVVLGIFSLEMLLGIDLHRYQMPQTVNIFPIAFPLLAGPGSLTILLSLKTQYAVTNILVGIILNMLLVYWSIKSMDWIEKKLGKEGLYILKKVFGIILLALAIKIFKTNANL